MTQLKEILIRRIHQTGPMTVAKYMTECLQHPQHGYYTTRDPLGAAGDFTTAPEISQMFGELMGLALAQHWLNSGAPSSFVLAEPGPGRGTLMADILRATKAVHGFHGAMSLHLVESSDPLKALQQQAVAPHPATWHTQLSDLPDAPLYLIANEFFDALPIRQFQRAETGWRERMIGVEGEDLCFGLTSDTTRLEFLEHRHDETIEGQIVEYSAPTSALAQDIGTRIAEFGGLALIVDYGGWGSIGDTLQAVKAHEYDPVFAHPGQADITAHVDFLAIAQAASPAAATKMIPQGELLQRLGIGQRAQALAQRLDGKALENHIAAYERLTHESEMGNVFKAIAIHHPNTPTPPGFEPRLNHDP